MHAHSVLRDASKAKKLERVTMNCKDCQSVFLDLLLDPGAPRMPPRGAISQSCAALQPGVPVA